MQTKKTKASVLVVSLIVMSIVLIASLSIALTAMQERKASIGASKTTAVFQSADKVAEQAMKEIQWGNHSLVSQLLDSGGLKSAGFTCSSGILVSGGYTISLLDVDSNLISCNNSDPITGSLGNVAKIKITSTNSQVGRAIEANVDCNIKTCQQLQNIKNYSGGYFCLANDVDCSAFSGFVPIATFTGVFDGKGAAITGLKITSNSAPVGLFGTLSGAVVKNLGIEGADISSTGASNSTGILAGKTTANTEISNCYTAGVVKGEGAVGGIIGEVSGNGDILKQSYSEAEVSTDSDATDVKLGGLIGKNGGTLENSFAVGNVTGKTGSDAGGLVGYDDSGGTIKKSYYGGKVQTGTNIGALAGKNNSGSDCTDKSYYNSTENPLPILTCGLGGTACTTDAALSADDMKKESNYSNWDFTENINNWQINEGNSYPCFQWQGGMDQCPAP